MLLKSQYWTALLCLLVLLPAYGADEAAGSDAYGHVVETSTEESPGDFQGYLSDDISDAGNDTSGVGKDIVLVLDNSVSMKKSDPDFLMRQASIEFINKLGEGDRIAIIIFDQDVSLTLPLTNVFDASKEHILSGLDELNYQGLFTDSPAAIERGLFELRNSARESVRKAIIFITDGSVDTGDVDVDIERTYSLQEDLKDKDAYRGVHLYGIGLTQAADQLFLQSITESLEGEAYLIQEAAELQSILIHIVSNIDQFVFPEPVAEVEVAPEVPEPEAKLVVPVVEKSIPVQGVMGKEERTRSIIIIISAIVLILALVAIIVLLVRRSRDFKATRGYEVEAYLNDYRGYTSQASYKLDAKPSMLGRVAGKDSEHLNFIVIPESTIGRRHALIDYKDYGYWISDQGSINGTFVNDKHITSEVRLKHGDKVRLHKYEFEFIMPETSSAGATVVATADVAHKERVEVEAEEVLQEVKQEMSKAAAELDLGFGAAAEDVDTEEAPAMEDAIDETLMPSQATIDEIDSGAGQDETLLPGAESAAAVSDELDTDDETLMSGSFEPSISEIEEEQEGDTSSYENFFDLTGEGAEEDKK